MSVKTISNWILPDRTFLPFSICSIGDRNKVVLILPGEGQVFTLVIKNVEHNIASGEIPHKISRIKLSEKECCLLETVATSTNTVSCKDNGEVVVFNSFRECTKVEGIDGVKAISSMEDGKKLVIIRIISGHRLQLEVYNDLTGSQIGNCVRSFDLSWDKNNCETIRYSQVYKIKTIVADRVNLKFFKRFLNCKDLLEGKEIMLFTMDNGLYWLKTYDNTYEIVTVKLCTAIILDFDFASSTGCFTVLLANAVMYINSISEDAENLLIQENIKHLGPTLVSHVFISEISTLLCSSEAKITQIRYYYSELTKSIQFVVKEFPIIGVTGITYLGFADIAICVTENRLFYSIPINILTDPQHNQPNDCFELTSDVLSQANQITDFLTNEVNAEKRIANEIEKERLQVAMLIEANNQNVCKFLTADIKFLKHLPSHSHNIIHLGESHESCLFIQIDIFLRSGIKEVLMRHQYWNMLLMIDEVVTQIPLGNIIFLNDYTVQFVVAIDSSKINKQGIPHIEIILSAQIRQFQDSTALDIPIKIKCFGNIAGLFDVSSYKPTHIAIQGNNQPSAVNELIRHLENQPVISQNKILFKQSLNGLKDVSNVGELLLKMGIEPLPTIANKVVEEAYLSVGNQLCEVRRSGQSDFVLETSSPGMLYLLKVLCSSKMQIMSRFNVENYKTFRLKLLSCETEWEQIMSYYRQIRTISGI